MAASDWLAYWGAALSTGLAIREVLKHRRATRPKLYCFLQRSSPMPGFAALTGGTAAPSSDHGETRKLLLHNRGGAEATIHALSLCVAARWCPRPLLGLLGELGAAPVDDPKPARVFGSLKVTVPAGQENSTNVVLWGKHRDALEGGRLMVTVGHTWSRGRPQQLRVKRDFS